MQPINKYVKAKACYYCGLPATGVDHVVPRVVKKMAQDLELDLKPSLVPCCKLCNSILGATWDISLLQRRRRAKRYFKTKFNQSLQNTRWSLREILEMGYNMQLHILRGEEEAQEWLEKYLWPRRLKKSVDGERARSK